MSLLLALTLAAGQQSPPVEFPGYQAEAPQPPALRPEPLPQEQGALPHIGGAFQATDSEEAVTNLDLALTQLPQPTAFRGMVQCMRGEALMRLKRFAGARDAIDECYRLLSDHQMAQVTRALLYIEDRDYVRAAPLIASAIRRDRTLAANLPVDMMHTILIGLNYARRDDVSEQLVTALVDSGFARDYAVFFSAIARRAVLYRVLRKDLAGAVALLPQITNPQDGLMMLIDRQFEPVWPQIEEWAHNDLAVQRETFVRQARARARVNDTLSDRVSLTGILEETGYGAEAQTMLEAMLADRAAWDEFGFEIGLAAVRLSRMLFDNGAADPDTVVAPMVAVLGDAPITPEKAGLHTVPPNLARRLIYQGRYDRALVVIDRYTPKAAAIMHGDDIGYMLAMRACALHRQGDAKRAAEVRGTLMASYAANRSANGMAASCFGELGDQIALIRKSMEEAESRPAALLSFARGRQRLAQRARAERESLAGSAIDAVYRDPGLIGQFAKYGRMLPSSFVPALNEWRDPKSLDAPAPPR